MNSENEETQVPQPVAKPTVEATKPKPTSVTIELDFPIDIGGTKTNKLTMRRPRVRDRMAVEQLNLTEAQKDMNMIANLCELTPEAISDIYLSDYRKVQDALMDFILPQPPPSKEQSSPSQKTPAGV